MQKIFTVNEQYDVLKDYLVSLNIKSLFLVCGKSIEYFKINDFFANLEVETGIAVTRFSDFSPNPSYDSVERGTDLFKKSECDIIVAVGGGSAIDVAKCIKLYCNMDASTNYLSQRIIPNTIDLIAIPTTAGTGSESTSFSVIYYEGVKQSVSDLSCIPSAIVLDPVFLKKLPLYHKKATMLDALCHATESFWSVNSTEESKKYAAQAIAMILNSYRGYLANDEQSNLEMLKAANIAGKAINITQTTAGHAMSYKLTSLYKIAHGHAVALCVAKLFPYMINHLEDSVDCRGEEYVGTMFDELARAYSCNSPQEAAAKYKKIVEECNLLIPSAREEDFLVLRSSVNPDRLKNNPIKLNDEAIDFLYHQIVFHI